MATQSDAQHSHASGSSSMMADQEETNHEQQLRNEEIQYQEATDRTMDEMASIAERAKHVAPELVLSTQAERVTQKKTTAEYALAAMGRMFGKTESSNAASCIEDYSEWKTTYRTILGDDAKFEFSVGFAGGTGMGKSSLINALLGKQGELAPSSQDGACTAAVCRFRYHDATKVDKPFKARVTFKSKEGVDQELVALLSEYREVKEDIKLNGTSDSVIRAEHDRLLDKLRGVEAWSSIPMAELETYGIEDNASEITRRCENGRTLFNYQHPQLQVTRNVSASNERAFGQLIRPFVGNVKNKKKALWPLIEFVDIYVDADILRHGIVLVDLPGEMDANDDRAQVAKDNYGMVDCLVIVAPVHRANDDQTSSELLREELLVDLEGDGKMNANGLCIVVTKNDEMMWDLFIEEGMEPEDISPNFPKLYAEYIAIANELQDGSLSEAQLQQLEKKRAKVDKQCLVACIKARARNITETFQKMAKKSHRDLFGGQSTSSPQDVAVIAVSSHAYRELRKGRPLPAFRSSEPTGIPHVKDWIVQASLQKRENHVDDMLSRFQKLFNAFEVWAIDSWRAKLLIPQSERSNIDKILDAYKVELRAEFKKSETNLKAHVNKHDKCGDHTHAEMNQNSINNFVAHVNSYSKTASGAPLHWATYKACIRRHGSLYKTTKKPRVTYNWQAKLATFYWRRHVVHWNQSYNQKLDTYLEMFIRRSKHRIEVHDTKIKASLGLPREYIKAFTLHNYKLDAHVRRFEIELRQAIRQFRQETRDIRYKSRSILNGPMQAAYDEACTYSGKGVKAKQSEAMEKHASKVRKELFAKVAEEVMKMLGGAKKNLWSAVCAIFTRLVDGISHEERMIAKSVCQKGKTIKKKKPSPASIQQLKTDIQSDILRWAERWMALQVRLPESKYDPENDRLDPDEEEPVAMAKPTKPKRKKTIKDEDSEDGMPLAKIPKKQTNKGKKSKNP